MPERLRDPKQPAPAAALRSALLLAIFTAGATYFMVHGVSRRAHGHAFPHGNPLLYSLAVSWLIALSLATVSSAILFRLNPALFSLARWEKQGRIYDHAGVRAFRWVLHHSPLGWINQNFHLRAGRADCSRLLREMNAAEGVHWLTCAVTVPLAISYLLHDHAVYGYVLLLVRIPFDLYPIMLQRWNRGRVTRILQAR